MTTTEEHIKVLQAFEQMLERKKPMKVKLLSRGDGKTTIAIRESALREIPIVCFSSNEVGCVSLKAAELGVVIPRPITFEDFLKKHHNFPEVIIDNLDVCFSRQMPTTKIIMVTMNDD